MSGKPNELNQTDGAHVKSSYAPAVFGIDMLMDALALGPVDEHFVRELFFRNDLNMKGSSITNITDWLNVFWDTYKSYTKPEVYLVGAKHGHLGGHQRKIVGNYVEHTSYYIEIVSPVIIEASGAKNHEQKLERARLEKCRHGGIIRHNKDAILYVAGPVSLEQGFEQHIKNANHPYFKDIRRGLKATEKQLEEFRRENSHIVFRFNYIEELPFIKSGLVNSVKEKKGALIPSVRVKENTLKVHTNIADAYDDRDFETARERKKGQRNQFYSGKKSRKSKGGNKRVLTHYIPAPKDDGKSDEKRVDKNPFNYIEPFK